MAQTLLRWVQYTGLNKVWTASIKAYTSLKIAGDGVQQCIADRQRHWPGLLAAVVSPVSRLHVPCKEHAASAWMRGLPRLPSFAPLL
jgi:hypothetical protein